MCRTAVLLALGITSAFAVGCGSSSSGGESTPVANDLLDPPAEGQGFQLGTTPFDVPAGSEIQNCYFLEVPSDTDVWVNRIQIAQEPGSHHMNVFRVKTIVNLGGKPGDVVSNGECFRSSNWADWPLVINSQQSDTKDWAMPDGVAEKFAAHELLMIQSHYVNATTQKTPGVGHTLINFYTTDASKVTAELGTVFATNQNIQVCPGQTDVKYTTQCRFAKTPVTIVGANGHFHSRGRTFTMDPWDPVSGGGAQFYESDVWDDPPFPTNLNIAVPAQGGVQFSCSFSAPADSCGDPTKNCCFTFGGQVETNEHCNAFVYYYPKQDTDQNCF
jgi:hypothetical protein